MDIKESKVYFSSILANPKRGNMEIEFLVFTI